MMWIFLLCLALINAGLLWHFRKVWTDKRFLLIIWGVAFAIRLFSMLFFNIHVYNGSFEHPDSIFWDASAEGIQNGLLAANLGPLLRPNYPLLTALLYLVFGKHTLLMPFVNITLSAWTVVLLYFLARTIFSVPVARITAILAAVHPGLIYWATQHLKEATILFLLVSVFLFFIPKKREYTFEGLTWALLLTSALNFFRPRIAALLSLSLLLGTITLPSRKKRAAIVLCSIFFIAFLLIAVHGFQTVIKEKVSLSRKDIFTDPLNVINEKVAHSVTVKSHTSFYNTTLEPNNVSTPAELFGVLPTIFYRFYLAPPPWQATSLQEKIFSFYMIYWYVLLLLSGYGVWLAFKGRNAKALVPLAFVAQLTFCLGLLLATVAPLVRWREMAFIFLLPFAALGIWHMLKREKNGLVRYLQK